MFRRIFSRKKKSEPYAVEQSTALDGRRILEQLQSDDPQDVKRVLEQINPTFFASSPVQEDWFWGRYASGGEEDYFWRRLSFV